jgi:hypothetical protein
LASTGKFPILPGAAPKLGAEAPKTAATTMQSERLCDEPVSKALTANGCLF